MIGQPILTRSHSIEQKYVGIRPHIYFHTIYKEWLGEGTRENYVDGRFWRAAHSLNMGGRPSCPPFHPKGSPDTPSWTTLLESYLLLVFWAGIAQ